MHLSEAKRGSQFFPSPFSVPEISIFLESFDRTAGRKRKQLVGNLLLIRPDGYEFYSHLLFRATQFAHSVSREIFHTQDPKNEGGYLAHCGQGLVLT